MPCQSEIVLGLNGLQELTNMVSTFDLPFPIVRFTAQDVERSDTCRIWVEAYEAVDKCGSF